MVDEWHGVHVGKKIESVGDVAISGFFEHHTLILLIGADFVARSVPRVCECHETAFHVRSRVNLRFPGDRSNAIKDKTGSGTNSH
jgi:hypothetical protein